MPDWSRADAERRHARCSAWAKDMLADMKQAHADRGALLARVAELEKRELHFNEQINWFNEAKKLAGELTRVTMKRDQYEQALYQSGVPSKDGEPDLPGIPECLVTLKAANTYLLGERENVLARDHEWAAVVEALRGALKTVLPLADMHVNGEEGHAMRFSAEDMLGANKRAAAAKRDIVNKAKTALALVTPAAREEGGDG